MQWMAIHASGVALTIGALPSMQSEADRKFATCPPLQILMSAVEWRGRSIAMKVTQMSFREYFNATRHIQHTVPPSGSDWGFPEWWAWPPSNEGDARPQWWADPPEIVVREE